MTDLNKPSQGFVPTVAYPFNAAPPQFDDALNTLSLSESAIGGQPFDILLVAANPGTNRWWIFDFTREINNLDGITALSVTDIGAIPEPASLPLLGAIALLHRRRRR